MLKFIPYVEPVDGWIKGFFDALKHVLTLILSLSMDIARIVYMLMLLVGVILWATGIWKYQGRQLIIGGILVAIFAEYIRNSL